MRPGMVTVDVHQNFWRCDLMMVWMVNDCNGLDLLADRWRG